MKHCDIHKVSALLSRFDLTINVNDSEKKIPGSFWGDDEAGLIKNTLHVKSTTPIHSLLHEGCHYICMDGTRRQALDTNAGGDYDEENAVCYLQIILSAHIAEMGVTRMLSDMDDWGYSFRLGSAKKWFEEDASDAKNWLLEKKLIDLQNQCLFNVNLLI